MKLGTVTRCTLALALLATAAPAFAQQFAYDLERLWLDPSARGSLVLGTGETLPSRGLRLSVAGGFERSPLVATADGLRGRGLFSKGDKLGDLVKDRWTLHATAAAAITDRLELGLRLPMTVSQDSPDVSDLRKTLVGTPSAMLRFGLSQQKKGAAVSSAVAVEAAYPVHRDDDVDGDPELYFVPRLEIGRRFSRVLIAANVGAVIRPTALKLGGDEELGNEYTGGVVVATTGAPLRAELSLRGAFNSDGVGTHGELLGGLRWGFRNAELFALGGPGLLDAPGTPAFRAVVGLALFTAEPSAAPPPPPPAPPPAAVDPCAPGQSHAPAQCPALDDDGDGVANGSDECPLVKGLAELKGCPATDGDGDGIPDHLDKCPAVKGLAEHGGCPPPDSDGDGITDDVDRCPSQPGIPEEQGCPPKRAEIKAGKIDIREKVFFDSGKATVQQRSHALLDDVAKLVSANPQVGRIRIEGHTDDRGKLAANRRLSQARAEAVKAYLVGRGVDAARLEAVGFGPDQPAQSSATSIGREANRRVEFTILGVDQP